MARYAERTDVTVDRSRAEIERILARYGATSFAHAWDTDRNAAMIAFAAAGRQIRIFLTLPDPGDREFTHTPTGLRRTSAATATALGQATRARWRALALIVKAKMEAIAAGIVTFDEEWLPHIVLPDASTVGEHTLPALNQAYLTGSVPDLLPVRGPRAIAAGGV